MASLTQTSIVARRAIRYSIYGILILISARVVIGAAIGVFRYFFPEPPPPPTVLFGKLPPIPVALSNIDFSKITLVLETPDGKLPVFTDKERRKITQMKVFSMPKSVSNLFSVQEGLNKGKLLGFEAGGQQVSETLYKFRHPSLPKTLEINIVSNNFSLSYDLNADPSPLETLPPSQDSAASAVRSYLTQAGLLPKDLTGPVGHEFLKVQEGKLVPALSLSEADLIKVNLYRSAIDDFPSLTGDSKQSNVWFLVSGSRSEGQRILAGEYHYNPLDLELVSTYPIKTTEEAWEELTQGLAHFLKSPPEGNAVVRRVYLGYFDPKEISDYYQPIFVFEGDDFLAYVPAVTSEYYGQ